MNMEFITTSLQCEYIAEIICARLGMTFVDIRDTMLAFEADNISHRVIIYSEQDYLFAKKKIDCRIAVSKDVNNKYTVNVTDITISRR